MVGVQGAVGRVEGDEPSPDKSSENKGGKIPRKKSTSGPSTFAKVCFSSLNFKTG
jgi:hypothetical protein